jgi:POT family proton-dependent oligopeptide transporter
LSLSPLDFRLLLVSILADRTAYYGLRSVVILYAIFQFDCSTETTLYHYSFLALILCSAQLLGGFLGDFVIGAKNGMLVGLGLCTSGAILVSIPDPTIYYIAIFLIISGAGFFRANTFSFISHSSAHDKIRLEKRFIAIYGFLNLGAFISSILVMFIAEKFGYFYSFMLILLLYIVSLSMVFIISQRTKNQVKDLSIKEIEPRPITASLLVLLLVFISSAAFWMMFEQYAGDIVILKMDFGREMFSKSLVWAIVWSSSVLLSLVLIVPYYFLAKRFSLPVKAAVAMILMGICWLLGSFIFSSEIFAFGLVPFIILTFIEACVDIIFTPTTLTFLALHSSKRYYGILYAVYSLVIYIGARILIFSESSWFEVRVNLLLCVTLIVCVIFYFLLPTLLKTKK